jgi:hypothetical protein
VVIKVDVKPRAGRGRGLADGYGDGDQLGAHPAMQVRASDDSVQGSARHIQEVDQLSGLASTDPAEAVAIKSWAP